MKLTVENQMKESANVQAENIVIPIGYKTTDLGLIPEDWEVKRLEDIADIDPENLSSDTNRNYNFKYISLENVDRGTLRGYTEQIFYLAPSRARRKIKKHDVLISTVRPNLKSHLIVQENIKNLICSTGFSVLRCNMNVADSFYVYSHFFANTIDQQINSLLTGSNYPAINSRDVKSLKICLPPLREQQAIAAAISDIDLLISSIDQLITKKRNIKLAAMQQLLTAKQRLPGFCGEWKTKRLSEFSQLNKGSQINKSLLESIGKYPVWNGGIAPSGYTENWNTRENTITISEGGNSCGFVNFASQKFWCGGHCYSICQIKQNVNQYFLFQKLKEMQKVIMGLRVGSGLPNIQKKNILNLEIMLPEDHEEQIAIANVLTDMDAELFTLEQRLNKTRELKQGMMQELLTGRIRLK